MRRRWILWLLVISPIPMGIGVVEGVMPLVYISLGVPGEAATVITLAFRGLTFWLPFAIGFLLLRRVKALAPRILPGAGLERASRRAVHRADEAYYWLWRYLSVPEQNFAASVRVESWSSRDLRLSVS